MSATNHHPSSTTFGQVERDFEPLVGLADTLLTTGESTIPRLLTTGVATVAGGSGTLVLTYFRAKRSEACGNVRLITSSAAAAATPTLCRVGIYEEDATGGVALVASTVNDTTLFAATNTVYTKALSSTFTKVKGKRYAFGVLVVSGTTMPSFAGITPFNASVSSEVGQTPRLSARLTGQTDLPATIASGSLANTFNLFYGVVTP